MDDDPAYDIEVACVSGNAPDCEASLRKAVELTLRRHATPAARISVALVDDACIAQLNELHLDHAGPTDVLAFDLRDDPDAYVSSDHAVAKHCGDVSDREVEGEIVVSVDTACREARARGHPVEAELALYTVHGVLHLLGYDDRQAHGAARMHEVEDEILSAMGWCAVYQARPR